MKRACSQDRLVIIDDSDLSVDIVQIEHLRR